MRETLRVRAGEKEREKESTSARKKYRERKMTRDYRS